MRRIHEEPDLFRAQLEPVLRTADFTAFDVERAVRMVATVAEKL